MLAGSFALTRRGPTWLLASFYLPFFILVVISYCPWYIFLNSPFHFLMSMLVFSCCVRNSKVGNNKPVSCHSFCAPGTQARLSWVLCSGSDRAAITVGTGLCSHLEAQSGKNCIQTHSVYWQNSFPVVVWPRILSSFLLLAGAAFRFYRPPSDLSMWLSPWAVHYMALCFFRASRASLLCLLRQSLM